MQRLGMRRLEAGVDDAGLQVAVDGVIADALLHKSLGFLAEIPQQAGTLAADEVYERFRVEALAAGKLAAVAPRGAPADAPGLEHDGLVAALGEVERGGDAGVAAADDADVAALRDGPRRQGPQPPGRGEIGRRAGRGSVGAYV